MEVTFSNDGRPVRYASGRYARWFIMEVLSALEGGISRQDIFLKHRIKECTLDFWVHNFASAAYKERIKRSTPQLRRSVVRAVLAGKMTINEAKLKCHVSADSVKRWIREDQQQENIDLAVINQSQLGKKKSMPDADAAQEQIKILQLQLADEKLRVAALNTLIDVAEEQLKINIRKKPGARQS